MLSTRICGRDEGELKKWESRTEVRWAMSISRRVGFVGVSIQISLVLGLRAVRKVWRPLLPLEMSSRLRVVSKP